MATKRYHSLQNDSVFGTAINSLKSQMGASQLLTPLLAKQAADAAAGTATAETPFFVANQAVKLTQIGIIPAAALTADNTNNAVITIFRRNADGTNQVTVAQLTTNVASGNWTAWVEKAMGALTNASLAAGQILTFSITKGGTGVVIPACLFHVQDTTFHLDQYENPVASATATDLPSSVTLVNECKAVLNAHVPDTISHAAADTNTTSVALASTHASDGGLAGAIALANDIKAKFNLHIAVAASHFLVDAVNTIATTNASDLPSLETLANAIKTALNAHVASGPSGPSIRVLDP